MDTSLLHHGIHSTHFQSKMIQIQLGLGEITALREESYSMEGMGKKQKR